MNNTGIRERVTQIVREFNENIPDDPQINLRDAGYLDSLAVINIISSLEDEFDIEFDFRDITKDNFAGIDAITAMVTNRIRQN